MKLPYIAALIILTLATGCVSPTQQKVTAAAAAFDYCKKMAKSGVQRSAIADHLFPKFEDIDVVMMSDQRYPSQAEVEAVKPYFRDRLACNRKLLADIERMGVPSTAAMLTSARRLNREVENIVAKFLSGNVTYGSYFSRLKNSSEDFSERNTNIERAEQQAAYEQRVRAYQNAVNGMADAFRDTPCIACGLSSPSDEAKAPPGNKNCTYKSGPYQWSKTVSGYVCPATDSSNGYFGTLIR